MSNSVCVVGFDEFNPDLLEIKPPKSETAKNGTQYYKALIRYNGGVLVLDVPEVNSSGPFWSKPREEDEGGYPRGQIRVDWDSAVNPNAEKIMKGYDKVYCALFRKLAMYGSTIGQNLMSILASFAVPEKLDEINAQLGGKTNRELLRDVFKNFYDFPLVKGSKIKDDRDFTKPKESWFILRKAPKSTPEDAGLDKYDCQFKFAIASGKDDPGMPWAKLTGEIKHTFRQEVTHFYIGAGKPSIQKKMIASTIYNFKKGSNVEYVEGKQDDNLTAQLSEEQKKQLLEQLEMVANTVRKPFEMPPIKEEPGTNKVQNEVKEEKKEMKAMPPLEEQTKTPVMPTPPTGGMFNMNDLSPEKFEELKRLMNM